MFSCQHFNDSGFQFGEGNINDLVYPAESLNYAREGQIKKKLFKLR